MDDYISKEELAALINRVAMRCMMTPATIAQKKLNGEMMTIPEMNAYNSAVSLHNEGVKEMAERLKDALKVSDPDDD